MNVSLYDPQTHTLKGPRGTRVLTPHIRRIMECLVAKPNGIPFEQLLDAMWPEGAKPAGAEHVLRVNISRLRKRIAETGARVSLDNVRPKEVLYVLREKITIGHGNQL